jgi:NAD-dependent deacetylase
LAHRLLVEIEHSSEDFTLITQNVDGLHQRAGSVKVIELHGSIWGLACTRCGAEWDDLEAVPQQMPPPCPQCGGISRPAVVWFGETLPEDALSAAHSAASKARTMLVIGTSAVVQPAASIPLIAQNSGVLLVEINIERTPLSAMADQVLLGSASECLETWWRDQRQGI